MPEIRSFEPGTLLLLALLNPAVVGVALWMGRRADQWQKVPIAAFAASLAGFILYWILAAVGLMPVHALGSEAGLLVLQYFVGLAWATSGYLGRGK